MTASPDLLSAIATERKQSQRALRLRWILLAASVVGLFGLLVWRNMPPARATVVRCAERLLHDRKAKDALAILAPLLTTNPADGDASFVAGQAHLRLKQHGEAAQWFDAVPADHPRRAEACLMAGDILLMQLHQLTPAEKALREARMRQPGNPASQGYLAGLYGLCGLTNLTASLRFERLAAGQFAEVDLLLLALGDTAAENSGALQQYVLSCPDDPLTQIARGHQAWQQHDLSTARFWFEKGLSQRPDLLDAQSRLGRILFEQSDPSAFLAWHAALGKSANEHPDTWVVRGDWSLREQDIAGGVRCFWEAVRRDPSHRRAHHQLGQSLQTLGESTLAEPFQRRNADLQELLLAAKQTTLDRTSTSSWRAAEAASLCGQPWEAWGWAEVARRRPQGSESNTAQFPRPASGTPRYLETTHLAALIDPDRFPLPKWMQTPNSIRNSPTTDVHVDTSDIHFSDDSDRTGLHFEYVSGDDLPGPGMRMFQFTGGGVGAFDFDRDGWPDLYLTQGGRWPVPEEHPRSDALFRNRFGETFENVALAAGIKEADYGQGLAVTDFDCDGWPDLFVANVAGNRLFRNNGDGTFQDVTESAQINGNAWSTSAVGADFNSDGLPDLYVVNYVAGPGLLDRICQRANGTPRACTPHEFDAADDQMLMNLGDGRFQDVSMESGILVPGGKGLGVVAADFEQSGRLSLFVANDTTANFYFQNRSHPGEIPRFEETAIISGLAFDGEGRAQACMGIAADDADGNGTLDLFATNYFNESNTLYLQQSSRTFLDTTPAAGLREPSLRQLGFGTQFLDADLDGWPDLIVTNGHVDDETARGVPLQMPTQIFRNVGKARFVEVPASQLGRWFQGKYLGRGLARIDWNRDGRDDFCVSTIDTAAALLTNQSVRRGRFLALKLVGTRSARIPIGARVHIQTGGRSIWKQLTTGDGYQASNEPRLLFATGSDEQVSVVIHWPSGETATFSDVASDAEWLAVEGKSDLVRLNP